MALHQNLGLPFCKIAFNFSQFLSQAMMTRLQCHSCTCGWLQDILMSLCQSLNLENQPGAAAEANRLAEEAQALDLSSDQLHCDILPNASRTFGEQRHRQPLHSTHMHQTSQHSRGNIWSSTERQASKGCSNDRLAAEAASLQSCPDSMTSVMSTSKASRYLQKRVFKRPSALQQMQAFAQRHSKAAACSRYSLADSCSSMTGMSHAALRQLPFALPAEATLRQFDGTGAAGTQQEEAQVQLCIQNNSLCSSLLDCCFP